MGFDLPVMNRLRRSGRALSPASLFATGAQGAIYDPRDLTTMFQDSTGTTPVTAPGQVVGLRLDKSKGLVLGAEKITNGDFGGGTTGWSGWNTNVQISVSGGQMTVTQPVGGNQVGVGNTAAFATVVGRTYAVSLDLVSFVGAPQIRVGDFNGSNNAGTFLFSESVGRKTGYFVANSTIAHVNVATASAAGSTITFDNISVRELAGNHAVQVTAGARLTYGIEPKTGTRNLLLATDTLATQSLTVAAVPHTLAFTGTGTVTLSGASTAGPLVGTGAGNRVTLTFTPTAASLTLTVSGSVTLGQLQLGSTDTPYQKVVTAFEVTEAGVPTCHYCAYAGANSMATAAIDFSATDKMSVFAGVRKLSDATAYAMVVELSAQSGANFGSFSLNAPFTASTYAFAPGGTNFVAAATGASFSAPRTDILTGLGDISGDRATLRVNGTQVAQNTGDQGSGNFGNYPLFLGRRNNGATPPSYAFTGRDYGIVIVGKATSAAEINITEAWLAANTPTVVL